MMIIGGSGSLGHTLVSRYLGTHNIYIYSRGENAQWAMKQKFDSNSRLNFYIGDIRDKSRLEHCILECKPSILIIASALKHIDICEKNITECISTNVDGIRNVLEIVTRHSQTGTMPYLNIVLFVSTDKACSPTNVYGMCKALSERLITENSRYIAAPRFVNVRYGNVLESRGSLIPLFKGIAGNPKQKFFTVTHPDMTRFFMRLDDSVDLIDYALYNAKSGDTIVPRNIASYRIMDIAKHFGGLYGKPVQIGVIRPGEKIDEVLISIPESYRTIADNNYYVIKPTFVSVDNPVKFSEDFSSKQSVRDLDDMILSVIG